MSKPIILTGLRANNDLHLGNYLGAMLPMVDMATKHAGEYQVNFFVPDLHSFTTPTDHGRLYERTLDNIRMYIAAGLPLDDDDINIYRQSFIPAHSELTWMLSCFTYFGEMRRMTQFKEKAGLQPGRNDSIPDLRQFSSQSQSRELYDALELAIGFINRNADFYSGNKRKEESVSVGLFSYPILMAADILLYGAKYVPVGDDQTQHLEFTRDIAERMNNKFGGLFKLPLPVKEQHQFFGKDQGLRIRDLLDPTKKMSKSDETGKGVVFLQDSPDSARKKIMSATTDSFNKVNYDYDKQPGISNLLDILKLLGGDAEQFIGQIQYGPLKTEVAEVVAGLIEQFQSRLTQVDDTSLQQRLAADEAKMNELAAATLIRVQRAVGLRA